MAQKRGFLQKISTQARMAARETGLLPHEWLLRVSRGEGILHRRWVTKYDLRGNEKSRELVEEEVYADFPTRLDAAKAAAPYFAPKLASQTVNVAGTPEAVAKALTDLAEKLPV